MKDSQHDLEGRLLELGLLVHGNTAAVVDDRYAVIGMDSDVDGVAVAGHGLVDAVIDDLAHEVMETARVGAADVHARAAANSFQSLQDLDVLAAVGPSRTRLLGWFVSGNAIDHRFSCALASACSRSKRSW